MIKDAGMIDLSIDVLKLAAIAIVFEGWQLAFVKLLEVLYDK
jgi:hypothetical protein